LLCLNYIFNPLVGCGGVDHDEIAEALPQVYECLPSPIVITVLDENKVILQDAVGNEREYGKESWFHQVLTEQEVKAGYTMNLPPNECGEPWGNIQ